MANTALLFLVLFILEALEATGATTYDPIRLCNAAAPLDVLFVIDATTALSASQCSFFMEYIAKTAVAIKGADASLSGYPDVRIAIVVDTGSNNVVIHLNDRYSDRSNINLNPVSADDITWLYDTIAELECSAGHNDLRKLIHRARIESDTFHDVSGRAEKMVIFSNEVSSDADTTLTDYAIFLDASGIEVIMVNFAMSASGAYDENNYVLGLTNGDPSRIFVLNSGDIDGPSIAGKIGICDACVDDNSACVGRSDGHYQNCEDCETYVSCVYENMYDDRPCAPSNGAALQWNDKAKTCDYPPSQTCA